STDMRMTPAQSPSVTSVKRAVNASDGVEVAGCLDKPLPGRGCVELMGCLPKKDEVNCREEAAPRSPGAPGRTAWTTFGGQANGHVGSYYSARFVADMG